MSCRLLRHLHLCICLCKKITAFALANTYACNLCDILGRIANSMRTIVTVVAWSLCMCVCLLVTTVSWAKMLNQSICCLGCSFVRSNRNIVGLLDGSWNPVRKSTIFSALFARGQERSGLWLPVYCSSLLLFVKRDRDRGRAWPAPPLSAGRVHRSRASQ